MARRKFRHSTIGNFGATFDAVDFAIVGVSVVLNEESVPVAVTQLKSDHKVSKTVG